MMEQITGETHRPGRIEVVCGSMFSGKTEELIRRMKRAGFARQRLLIFKPAIDTRYSSEDVVSHDRNVIKSIPVKSAKEILDYASEVDLHPLRQSRIRQPSKGRCRGTGDARGENGI